MNSFADPFINYDQSSSTDTDPKLNIEFLLTSPHSDSTTQYANSLSPNVQELMTCNQEAQFEYWNQETNYGLNTGQTYSKGSFSIKEESEEKLSSKSKRIMKRAAAKERTKVRKDATAFLAGIDKKFLPEGFDDPNLDEKTRKKMIQMVRNRISAQNSRDRKKVLQMKLEEVNAQLNDEISNLQKEKGELVNEISRLQQNEAQLLQEVENLRRSNVCPSCGRAQNGDELLDCTEYNQQEPTAEDNSVGGFGGLASPILSRFPSSGRGLFGFFAFAAIVCVIVVMNVQPGGEVGLAGAGYGLGAKDTRLLEVQNEVCQGPVRIGAKEPPFKDSLILQNMGPLKNNFNMNYDVTFRSHLQKLALLPSEQESVGLMRYEESLEYQNAIVDYNYFNKATNLRRKMPTIIARDLPFGSDLEDGNVQTSTLFCPNGLEFLEQKNQSIGGGQGDMADRILNLEKADYLQLFVPKQGVARYSVHDNLNDLYDLPMPTEGNDNPMLEIWCKVFLIRDLSSSL